MNPAQTLQFATQEIRAGRLANAEALLRPVLAAQPGHAAALHLLGVAAQQAGRAEEAVRLLRQAIAANPDVQHYHNNPNYLA